MKRYIHDGVGLRVMRGQENELETGGLRFFDMACPCGFCVCTGDCANLQELDAKLPEGWAPGLGGYFHVSGAEVQRRGEMWAWFPKGEEICLLRSYKATLEEALLCAAPRWGMIHDWNGRPVFMLGMQLVYMDGDLWKHNRATDVWFLSPEAAMLAAEKKR